MLPIAIDRHDLARLIRKDLRRLDRFDWVEGRWRLHQLAHRADRADFLAAREVLADWIAFRSGVFHVFLYFNVPTFRHRRRRYHIVPDRRCNRL